MHPVSFDRARRMLPGYSSALWPKPISDEMKALDIETTALAMLKDVPEDYKALILGIRIAKLTDGATLLKAVTDLGPLIKDAPSGAPTVTSATAATTLSSAAPASTAARTAATPTSDPTAKPSAAALSTTTAATDAAAAPATASAVTEDAAGTRTPTGPDTTSDAKSLGQPSPGSAQTNRTVGILAYGSLIDDPGSEIAEATDRTEDEQVMTPFKVEFARSSASRGGAPTLIPVPAGGREIPAKIFVMKNNVTEQDAIDRLWRREIDRIGSGRSYLAPS
jgi:hypothetical protein